VLETIRRTRIKTLEIVVYPRRVVMICLRRLWTGYLVTYSYLLEKMRRRSKCMDWYS
jgi:hypothetical protein